MDDFNTLGDLLLRKYVTDFVKQMQNISSPIYSQLRGGYAGMECRMSDLESIFFRQDRWSIVRVKEEIGLFDSVIGHRCVFEEPKIFLSILTGIPGKEDCAQCRVRIPNNVVGLWKMHNFEVYQTKAWEA